MHGKHVLFLCTQFTQCTETIIDPNEFVKYCNCTILLGLHS